MNNTKKYINTGSMYRSCYKIISGQELQTIANSRKKIKLQS